MLVEVFDEAEDVGAGTGVEVAGGLVGEEERGLGYQGAGQDHALLFPAGKFAGAMGGAGFEAYVLESGVCFGGG